MKQNLNNNWIFWKDGQEQKQKITVPHDAMLKEQRTPDAPAESASGYFPGGVYYYEKELEITTEMLSQHLTLEFEGVYKNAEVFVNGEKIYQAAYGYIPFFVCLDSHVKEGKNTLLVKTDNSKQPDSRWYTGAGIYRPVWLHVQNQTRIEIEGVRVKTLSISPTTIEVSVEKNGGNAKVEILNAEGNVIVAAEETPCVLEIPNAELWSEHNPYLYTAKVTLSEGGETLEVVEETFGIRMLSWSPKGFFVNGVETLLKGGCVHHDNGIVGACAYDESEERRVRILKENGFNAIRSSHNPCSKAMLRACDKLGVYMMDELWDMWYRHKSKYDYATEFMDNYKYDIRAFVRRDYNHPSVIMYSIGNEVSEPAEAKGVELAKEMASMVREMDDSRPVVGGFNLMIISNSAKGKDIYKEDGGRDESGDKKMAGMNSTMFNMITSIVGSGMNKSANSKHADEATTPVLSALDISGYNYASGRYVMEGTKHPERIIMGGETFPQDIAKNWEMVKSLPYLIGDFMWTAWDYLGEAGIGAWSYHQDAKGFNKPYPWLLGDTGAFDILGNPNAEAFLAQAAWDHNKNPLIAVQPIHPGEKLVKASWRGTNGIPSWSFAGCDGAKAVVEVFTSAPTVELKLDGKSLGKKKTKLGKATFKVKYQPGTLTAYAYEADGSLRGNSKLVSAAKDLGIVIEAEDQKMEAGKIVYVNVAIADNRGTVESKADTKLKVSVEGGELLGFGSANPRTEERFDAGSYTTYYGRAQAVIRVTGKELKVIVESEKYGKKEAIFS